MTTPQLLQQAKQGNPDAIAQLMNQSLETKGIRAAVSRRGDCLRVLLNSENELSQAPLTQFIHKGIQNLNVPDVNRVEVVGQSQKNPQAWTQTLTLRSPRSNAAIAPPPVPPSVPTPPPVPPSMPPQVAMPPAPPPSVASVGIPAPPPPIPQPTDDLDLSAAALDDDFSLDEELSMAEIDQIVADAVRDVTEVTTKIQSEIPFDPDLDPPGGPSLSASIPGSESSDSITDDMDEAIRQAMQANNLDQFIDQELASPDAVTTIEPDLDALGADPFPGLNSSATDTSRLAVGMGAVGAAVDSPPYPSNPDGGVDAEPAEVYRESAPKDITQGGSTPASSPASDQDEAPASRLLLVLVSLLTFGAIAGLIGYSLRAYASNWKELFARPGSLIAPDNASNTGAADTTSDAGTNEGGNGDASAATDVATDTDGDEPRPSDNAGNTDEFPVSANVSESDGSDATDPPQTPGSGEQLDTTNASGSNASDAADSADSAAGSETSPAVANRSGDAIAACPSVVIGGGQTVTITQITLDQDRNSGDSVYPIIGCLTNHTDTPIISAAIKYQGQPAEAAADIVPQDEWALSNTNVGLGQLVFGTIAPKSTVTFSAQLPVAEGTTSIDLNSLAWRPEGWEGDAKLLPLEFSMTVGDN